jgi:hypothetical protein
MTSGSSHADLGGETEAVEPARGEQDRIETALASLAKPRVDVPAQRLDRETRLEGEKLCTPARGRGADPHPGRISDAPHSASRGSSRADRADRQPAVSVDVARLAE